MSDFYSYTSTKRLKNQKVSLASRPLKRFIRFTDSCLFYKQDSSPTIGNPILNTCLSLIFVLAVLSSCQLLELNDFFLPFHPEDFIAKNKSFGKPKRPIGLLGVRLVDYLGVNYEVKENAPALSIQSGKVEEVGNKRSQGGFIIINHGEGIKAKYYHLKELRRKVGEIVSRGQVIGISGMEGLTTVNSIGIEIRVNGKIVDPESILKGSKH